MSALTKRLAKLEGIAGGEDVIVILHSFCGSGEYVRAKGKAGEMVERSDDESEKAFTDRAIAEIVAAIKSESGPQPCYVVQLLRKDDRAFDIGLQPRPQLTRDEWLIAHGLQPVDQ